MSLGDVGSIVFELDGSVAVVTRIADKVLLAAVGPSKLDSAEDSAIEPDHSGVESLAPSTSSATGNGAALESFQGDDHTAPSLNSPARNGNLDIQHEADRNADLARLSSLNLSASPSVLLALESKCAALGRFLGEKLSDLEIPEEF